MRGKRAIMDALKASNQFDKTLADEICYFCIKHRKDVFQEFIDEGRGIPHSTLDSWLEADAVDYINDRMQEGHNDPWSRKNKAAFRDACLDLMARHFVPTAENGYTLYAITDADNRVLAGVPGGNVEKQIGNAIKDDLEAQGPVLDAPLLNLILSYFQIHATRVEPPKLLGQREDQGWCLSRASVAPDSSVLFPRWTSFIRRLNDGDAFCAFVGGVYYGLNDGGRQILYISDRSGEGAKTQAMNALHRLVGDVVTAGFSGKQLEASVHSTAMFRGKRLAIIGDNNDPNIIMRGSLKGISGEDKVPIDEKYQPVFSTYLSCKIIITSNLEPNITHARHNISRTLWLQLAPLVTDAIDPDWGNKLDDEAPGFLAYCLECYRRRCPDNYEIQVNEAVQEAVQLKIEEFSERHSTLFDRLFVVKADGKLSASQFYEALATELRRDDHEIANFKRWMYEAHGIDRELHDGLHIYPGLAINHNRTRARFGGDDELMQGAEVKGEGFTTHHPGPTSFFRNR